MGCDIHGWIEVRRKDTGEWLSVAKITGDRDYLWFGVIADVRSEPKCGCTTERRGIPDDASYPVKVEHDGWGSDAHSTTYLNKDEISQCWKNYIDERYYDEDDLESALKEASGGKKLTHRDKAFEVAKRDRATCPAHYNEYMALNDILPEFNVIGDFIKTNTDIDIKIEVYDDEWYDDIRMVVWFDN